MPTTPDNPQRRRDLRWLRGLLSLMSAVFFALGLSAIVTEQYSGHTKRGGTIFLAGHDAVLMGLAFCACALLLLTVWCRTRRAVYGWLGLVVGGTGLAYWVLSSTF